MINYSELLTGAWRATWKYRAMWLLGMAIIGGCNVGGATQFSYGLGNDASTYSQSTDYETVAMLDALTDLAREYWLLLVLIGVCLFLLACTALVIHYIALGGIYRGAALAKQNQPVQFTALCRAGTETFWPVLAVSLLFKIGLGIITAVVVLLLVILALTIVGLVIVLPLVIILVCLALPLRSVISSLYSFTIQGIVLQQLSIGQSWQQAWRLWKANWLDALLIYLCAVGWKVIVQVLCFIGLVLLAMPVALFGYLAYTSEAWLSLGLGTLALVGLLAVVGFLVKGINQSFSTHLWHRGYAALAQR
ncbi:MAG: hypothetical protein HY565_03270 [Candidatus Kerfeldbacteria bacterium]|nr:hypothetical protein [Candidatus Kerfeldbacteria bacterium]